MAGYDLGCLSIEVRFKAIHWMVEMTQEESVTKTETWEAPTVRDLTEEEENSEDETRSTLQKKWGKKGFGKIFERGKNISIFFMERMLSYYFFKYKNHSG